MLDFAVSITLALTALSAFAQLNLPDSGTTLLPQDALFNAEFTNSDNYPVELTQIDADGQPFQKALQIRTEKNTVDWWAVQLLMKTTAPVDTGDAVMASFYMRCAETRSETGEGRIRVLFQSGPPDYVKSLVSEFTANSQWRKIDIPFTVAETTGAGGSMLGFTFPVGPQTIQIGGVTLTNYKTAVSFANAAASTISYSGREPDAPWRAAAQQRIDQIRKADLRITVKTAAGDPAPGATVAVNMTRHAFPFGSAVAIRAADGRRFAGAYKNGHWYTPEEDRQYLAYVKKWFNKVTPETALMPGGWTGLWPNLNRDVAIQGVREFMAMGYPVRGHMLAWPSWQWMQIPGIEEAKNNPEQLRKLMLDHITDEVSTLKDLIGEWTLLNEAYAHHDIIDALGNDAMVDWFNAAHQANPTARLYINDYGILSGGGLDKAHQDAYAETIQFLIDKSAPLHGIGFQGHFGDDPTDPEKIFDILNRFAAFGKEMQITEFDVNTRDSQLQADYTRDFLTICFSHPGIIAFTFWGFWETDHWRPDCAMIDKNWKLKPSGEAYEQLVLRDWWTEEEGVTDKTGAFTVRGFLGDYQIVVLHHGRSLKHHVTLQRPGADLHVIIDAPPTHPCKKKARATE